jgi:uncharacterized membrane protein YphA (DoxX/SURF4 family)
MSVPRALLVILRLHLGVILLLTVLGKLTRSPAYLAFIRHVVRPHPTRFARLVMAGGLTAAPSLLTGTGTRVGAAGRARGVDAWLARRWPAVPAW